MKDYKITRYGDYFQVSYNDYYIDDRKYKNYEDAVNDIYKYYQNSNIYEPEMEEERLRKEKVEKRNSKIDQILG